MDTNDNMKKLFQSEIGKYISEACKVFLKVDEKIYNLPSIKSIAKAYRNGMSIDDLKSSCKK